MAFDRRDGFTHQVKSFAGNDLLKSFMSNKPKFPHYDTDVYIGDLIPFPDHPFRMYPQDKLEELAESIKEYGILSRVVVRKVNENGQYVILSGHNRTAAARLAGLSEVPVTVVDVDDDTARIMVTDANLKQREKLYPSEKARAYKMQLDAIKRQGKRTDLLDDEDFDTSAPLERKLESSDIIGAQNNESRAQIRRYIRLLSLSQQLLDMVDGESIPFRAGVDVSYLAETEQRAVHHILSSAVGARLTLDASRQLKEQSKAGLLTPEVIQSILINEPVMADVIVSEDGQRKKEKQSNPYAHMLKNLGSFLKKLPLSSVTPEELEQAVVAAVENLLRDKAVEQ